MGCSIRSDHLLNLVSSNYSIELYFILYCPVEGFSSVIGVFGPKNRLVEVIGVLS